MARFGCQISHQMTLFLFPKKAGIFIDCTHVLSTSFPQFTFVCFFLPKNVHILSHFSELLVFEVGCDFFRSTFFPQPFVLELKRFL